MDASLGERWAPNSLPASWEQRSLQSTMASKTIASVLVCLALIGAVVAHGRLTNPVPRTGGT